MTRRRSMSSESFLLQSDRRSVQTTLAQAAHTTVTSSSTPMASRAPCLHEVNQSSLNSFAGRVSIPTTRGLGSSPTYTPPEQLSSISRPARQGVLRKLSFRSSKARQILRKASGLQEHASMHSSQIRIRQGSPHCKATGAITPPSVKHSAKRLPSPLQWDELAPNAALKHRLVCLRARDELSKGTITKPHFVDIVLESAPALRLPEAFAAEYFVDICFVGGAAARVAGRGQLRRLRKHRNLLEAAAREQYNDSQIDVGSASDDDLSVGSDWETDYSDDDDDSSDEFCAT